MAKALYRKYRPKSLSEVVGQEHITQTLSNAIKSGKISHAYLLTGPRGVGKTSIARILAHEVNGLEYGDDSVHLDIIEIDAASNRRIDEIRDLRDKVNILPTSSKYKVYIIDEVHMLTREAFNALLKTLEEPPAHAIFILATTEAHKLPETIVSRTQHFSFKPIELSTIVDHLKKISASEKFKIDNDALGLIAQHGDGSFRDSISLLDQARSISDKITLEQVQQLLGIAPDSALEQLIEVLNSGTPKQLFEILISLREQGLQTSILAKQLGQKLRTLILDDPQYANNRSTKLLNDLLNVSGSPQPDRALEIVLLDYIFSGNPVAAQTAPPALTPTSTPTPTPKPTLKLEVKQPAAVEKKEAIKSKVTSDAISFTIEAWPLVVAEIKKSYNTLYGILKNAKADWDGETLTLGFAFKFHQKQINEAKNRKIIEDIIKRQTGDDVLLVCVMANIESKPKSSKPKVNHLDTVSNIFGGGEVLESGA